MAGIATILRAAATVALTTALTACSGAPASSPNAVASPTASPTSPATTAPTPSPSATLSASPSATPAATETPEPGASAKPRPSIDQSDLDAILTSSITLLDLAEGNLAVMVAYVDPGSDDSISLGTYSLASTDQLTNQVPAGTYRLDFRQPADSAIGTTCTIEIADGDAYVFAAVEGAIAITLAGEKPSAPGDLFVATSSLCLK